MMLGWQVVLCAVGVVGVLLAAKWSDEHDRGRPVESWAWFTWPALTRGKCWRVGISQWDGVSPWQRIGERPLRRRPARSYPRWDRHRGYWSWRLPCSRYCVTANRQTRQQVAEHKARSRAFWAPTPWSDPASDPVGDIRRWMQDGEGRG